MKTALVLSFSEAVGQRDRRNLVERAGRALRRVAGPDGPVSVVPDGDPLPDEVLLVAQATPDDTLSRDDGAFAVMLATAPYTVGGCRLDGVTFLQGVATEGDALLAQVAPPFAALWRRSAGAPVELVTDCCGLRHVYIRDERDWAAVGASSVALALLGDIDLDESSLGMLAVTGNLHGDRTPFLPVRKLDARTAARMAHGVVQTRAIDTDELDPAGDTTESLVGVGVETLRGLLDAAISAHDGDVTLELSGGIDSRLLLAATSADVRARLHTITLGTPTSPDLRVAREIVAHFGLEHQVIDLNGLERLDPATASDLVTDAALRNDASAMAVANAVLAWVEAQVPQGPRFNGINGEYARGRFYAGQRAGPRTERRVESLVRWRVFANDGVDPRIFAPGFVDDARRDTLALIQDEYLRYPEEWLRATDDHFLYGRMQHWTGIEFSASCMVRPILAPFFCQPFLEWSRRLDVDQKRNARVFSMVIERFDPELARIPLVSGFTPAELARRPATMRLRSTAQAAQKVARKVRQRLSPGTDTPAAGAPLLARSALAHWVAEPTLLDPLAKFAFLDDDAVGSIASGALGASPATVGFLADLLAIGALQDVSD